MTVSVAFIHSVMGSDGMALSKGETPFDFCCCCLNHSGCGGQSAFRRHDNESNSLGQRNRWLKVGSLQWKCWEIDRLFFFLSEDRKIRIWWWIERGENRNQESLLGSSPEEITCTLAPFTGLAEHWAGLGFKTTEERIKGFLSGIFPLESLFNIQEEMWEDG